MHKYVEFETLKGLTLSSIAKIDGDVVIFTTVDGREFKMYHVQDCCERVTLEDVNGNFDDLIGSPILMAEEVSNSGENSYERYTWTFYNLATAKGYVTLRWYGSSNGYYSESVDLVETTGSN